MIASDDVAVTALARTTPSYLAFLDEISVAGNVTFVDDDLDRHENLAQQAHICALLLTVLNPRVLVGWLLTRCPQVSNL